MRATVHRLALLAALSAGAKYARAEGVPQPLISPDDRGTDGLLARYSIRVSAGDTQVSMSDARTSLYSFQTFIGPVHDTALDMTSFRIGIVAASLFDANRLAGPLTVAAQRYFPIEPLFTAPLLALHFGIEGAIATPWLSGQRVAPPMALSVMGVDTELANNGWDFRPSGWIRLDFLACRNIYAELGGGPELFAPANGPNVVALRYRAAAGFDIGCDGRDSSQFWRPGFIVEYRGRGVVHEGAADPHYDGMLSGGLQLVMGPVTVGLTYGVQDTVDRHVIGIRLQSGFWGNR